MNGIYSSIRSTSSFQAVVISVRHRRLWGPSCRFLWTVFRDFFWPQFHARYFFGRYPLKKLVHPLDSRVPFVPSHINLYLSFVQIWMKTLAHTYKTVGKPFVEDIRIFLEELRDLYRYAAKVYKKNQSTTDRPEYPLSAGGILVKLADPHRHCFPSLHVIIVFFNCHKLDEFCLKYGEAFPRLQAEKEYARSQAHKITEAVLLVKQHSIYCIPAAMFLLTQRVHGFSREVSTGIISRMFEGLLGSHPMRGEIRDQVLNLYLELMEAASGEKTCREVLLDFLGKV